MVIPGKFHPKNLYEKVKFWEKKFRFLKGVSGSVSKWENDDFGMWGRIFFFVEKKVDHSVFRGEIYRRLP